MWSRGDEGVAAVQARRWWQRAGFHESPLLLVCELLDTLLCHPPVGDILSGVSSSTLLFYSGGGLQGVLEELFSAADVLSGAAPGAAGARTCYLLPPGRAVTSCASLE